jgi:isopenicillin-N epimerase
MTVVWDTPRTLPFSIMKPLYSRRALLGALGAGALVAPVLALPQTFSAGNLPISSRGPWRWLRSQLVLEPGLIWLDTAGFGPTIRAAMAQEYRERERQSLDFRAYSTDDPLASTRRALLAAARFFNTDPGDLVLTTGTRAGIGIVAAGLELQPGDEVLTTGHDHPAAVAPWLAQVERRGIRVVQLPQPGIAASPQAIVERIASALTQRTKLLLVSHVQYTDGTVMPVRELCGLARANGVFSLVDGAQAPGQIELVQPVEIGCDAYATCLHKWLNGPVATGVLYLRRDVHARLWPQALGDVPGAAQANRAGEPPDAPVEAALAAHARFGGALVHRTPSVAAMPPAFELQLAVDRTQSANRVRALAAFCRDALTRIAGVEMLSPVHPSLAAGIVSFRVPTRNAATLVADIARDDRIVLGHVRHGAGFDAIRISLHPGTDFDELERCAAAVQRRV